MKMQVWWIPQVPMEAFKVEVDSFKEAVLLLKTLADYDIFQLEHDIKPDYSNVGGLSYWDDNMDSDEDGDKWCDWEDEDGDDIWEYVNGCKNIKDFETIRVEWLLNKVKPN